METDKDCDRDWWRLIKTMVETGRLVETVVKTVETGKDW